LIQSANDTAVTKSIQVSSPFPFTL
jgi:hypothetical protein